MWRRISIKYKNVICFEKTFVLKNFLFRQLSRAETFKTLPSLVVKRFRLDRNLERFRYFYWIDAWWSDIWRYFETSVIDNFGLRLCKCRNTASKRLA